MATAILYTTLEAIRATIGIDENDLSDQMILDQNLELVMLERLSVVIPTHETKFDSSEDAERRLTLWCQYFGALELLENTSLGIPQKFQANNDQLSRYDVDFEKIKDDLRRKLGALENRLNDVVVATGALIMGASLPNYDPVVGP